MRFLLDESAVARLLPFLRSRGDDATRIAGDYPAGLADRAVLALAAEEERILITADRDFGELIFCLGLPHQGVILFRLGDFAEIDLWITRFADAVRLHKNELGQFLVVTRRQVRIRRQ